MFKVSYSFCIPIPILCTQCQIDFIVATITTGCKLYSEIFRDELDSIQFIVCLFSLRFPILKAVLERPLLAVAYWLSFNYSIRIQFSSDYFSTAKWNELANKSTSDSQFEIEHGNKIQNISKYPMCSAVLCCVVCVSLQFTKPQNAIGQKLANQA